MYRVPSSPYGEDGIRTNFLKQKMQFQKIASGVTGFDIECTLTRATRSSDNS